MAGRARLVRGTVAGTVATGFALLFHVLAGGHFPAWLGITIPWILSVLISVTLSRRDLSAVSLGLSALASQYLFHWLFVLGASPAHHLSPAATHHGAQHGTGQHGHHVGAMESAGAQGHHLHAAHGGDWMWLAHVAAAALTTLVLYRGEVLLRRLRLWCDVALSRLLRRVPQALVIHGHRQDSLVWRSSAPFAQRWLPGACSPRGPPAAAVALAA